MYNYVNIKYWNYEYKKSLILLATSSTHNFSTDLKNELWFNTANLDPFKNEKFTGQNGHMILLHKQIYR